jgi:hypothetical protein
MPRRPLSSAREADGDKRAHTFAAVEAIGRGLPDVEVTTAWGQPALKVHGKHYLNHPCVLVRLPRIRLDALRDLVVGAHRFVNLQIRNTSDTGIRRGTARRSRDRR